MERLIQELDNVWLEHAGMDTVESAQELVNAMRVHYNFIRGNQAIGGQTPAEAAGINLNIGEASGDSCEGRAR